MRDCMRFIVSGYKALFYFRVLIGYQIEFSRKLCDIQSVYILSQDKNFCHVTKMQ